MRTSWSVVRKAKRAAKDLERALFLIESAEAVCTRRQEEDPLPTAQIRRAKSEIESARQIIEGLTVLSFTVQCRFYRLFECLEECLDYAVESMAYEELEAARVDLSRSIARTRDALSLLTACTGVKAGRRPLLAISRRFAFLAPREFAAVRKHPENVIHLFQSDEPEVEAGEQRKVMLM